MDSPNSELKVDEVSFQNLPPIQDLASSGNIIENYIKGSTWANSYNCITELRKINKYHPEFIPDIIQRYSSTILDLLSTGKTLLAKNILNLIKQLFDAGQQINVQKAVYAFLPVLIKKASTDIGYMKTVAQQVLTSFLCNCGYEISFVISSEYCCDKNSSVAELSMKLLTHLIEKVGSGVMQLTQNTLTCLMKCLSTLIDGKRQNLRVAALDICISMCKSIGSDNYLQLMQFCLKQEEIKSMGVSMQSHRQNKDRPMPMKQAIKSRQTQSFNQGFFNADNDNNFIPLGQKNMNYNNNYNTNYSNQYNQGYY